MLPGRCQYLLSKFLSDIAKYERQIETLRELLIENLEFDFSIVYKYFAYENKNNIDANSIHLFLKKNDIQSIYNEIQFIIFFYDKDDDTVLSMREFINLILPEKNFAIKYNIKPINRCFIYDKKVKLPLSIKYSLCSLFQKELELIRLMFKSKEHIKTFPGIDIHDIYHGIKGFDDIINIHSLYTFLKKNYFKFNEEDLNNIMKRLDINKDSKIDFYEFHQFFCFPNISCKCSIPCDKCKHMACDEKLKFKNDIKLNDNLENKNNKENDTKKNKENDKNEKENEIKNEKEIDIKNEKEIDIKNNKEKGINKNENIINNNDNNSQQNNFYNTNKVSNNFKNNYINQSMNNINANYLDNSHNYTNSNNSFNTFSYFNCDNLNYNFSNNNYQQTNNYYNNINNYNQPNNFYNENNNIIFNNSFPIYNNNNCNHYHNSIFNNNQLQYSYELYENDPYFRQDKNE